MWRGRRAHRRSTAGTADTASRTGLISRTRGLAPPDAALRRAIGDDPTWQRPSWIAASAGDLEHEGRAAEDRRVDVGGRDAEIFARLSPEVRLCVRGAEEPSTSLTRDRNHRARGRSLAIKSIGLDPRDLAEIAFGGADDCRATALGPLKARPSAGMKNRIGRLVATGLCSRRRTRKPIATTIGHRCPRPGSQAKTLIAIDEGNVVGLACAGMGDGGGVDVASPEATRHSSTVEPNRGRQTG